MREKRTVDDGAQATEDVRAQTLLPCPFCGGRPAETSVTGEHWFMCLCVSCQASTGMTASAESAREAWNRRTPPSDAFNPLEHEQAK
jgi:Lar family restriction alleviation protein